MGVTDKGYQAESAGSTRSPELDALDTGDQDFERMDDVLGFADVEVDEENDGDENTFSGNELTLQQITLMRNLQLAKDKGLLPPHFFAWTGPFLAECIGILDTPEYWNAGVNKDGSGPMSLIEVLTEPSELTYTMRFPFSLPPEAATPFNPDLLPVIDEEFYKSVKSFLSVHHLDCVMMDRQNVDSGANSDVNPAARYFDSYCLLEGGILFIASYQGENELPSLFIILITENLSKPLTPEQLEKGSAWMLELASHLKNRVHFLAQGMKIPVSEGGTAENIRTFYNGSVAVANPAELLVALSKSALGVLPRISAELETAAAGYYSSTLRPSDQDDTGLFIEEGLVSTPEGVRYNVNVNFMPVQPGGLLFNLLTNQTAENEGASATPQVLLPYERCLNTLQRLDELKGQGLLPDSLAAWPSELRDGRAHHVEYLLPGTRFSVAEASEFLEYTPEFRSATTYFGHSPKSDGWQAFDHCQLPELPAALKQIGEFVSAYRGHVIHLALEQDNPTLRQEESYPDCKKGAMFLSPGFIILANLIELDNEGMPVIGLEVVLLPANWHTPLSMNQVDYAIAYMLKLQAELPEDLTLAWLVNGELIELAGHDERSLLAEYEASGLKQAILPLMAKIAHDALSHVAAVLTATVETDGNTPLVTLWHRHAIEVAVGGISPTTGEPYAMMVYIEMNPAIMPVAT